MKHFRSCADVVSWGRTIRARHDVAVPAFRDELPPILREGAAHPNGALAIGLGRSYGDSGLNPDGAIIDMSSLDRIVDFDATSGVVVAEAGVSFERLLEFAVPRGFFPPVTPGTRFVTLGGAIANDVHGKNHHSAGSIGRWVREIGVLRSDGQLLSLSPEDNPELLSASIGGLGLTGVITHVALKLKPIASAFLSVENIRFGNLDEFFSLARESVTGFEYTVAWIDCLARGRKMGRGVFTRANHCADGSLSTEHHRSSPSIPFDAPGFALNRFSIAAFNAAYYAAAGGRRGVVERHYGSFFYPLDSIRNWNRLYGRNGMYQYQGVVPPDVAKDATAEMLEEISRAGQGSFLAVLKTFGALRSPGLLSFPREGATLALDFPNRGKRTFALLERLDAIVDQAGGRLYPAKDGRITPEMFRKGYPAMDAFMKHADPALSSSFWRRMMEHQ